MDWNAAALARVDSRLSIHDSEVPPSYKSESLPDDDWQGEDPLEALEVGDTLQKADAAAYHATAEDAVDVLIQGMTKSMLGVTLFFRGKSGPEVQRTWAAVAAKGKKMDQLRFNSREDEIDVTLAYDLHAQAKVIDYQTKMLRTVEVYQIFITELNNLVQKGPDNRKRVLQVQMGGADMLVAATGFLTDESLLEDCVDAIRRLCLEAEARRYLLKDRVDCAKALAGVLATPHRANVIEHTIEGLALLCQEHNVTPRMVKLGVLNAVVKLCCTVGPRNIVVLRSCASMARRMAGDSTCAAVMTERALDLARALFRLLKICDDQEAVVDAASTLEKLCESSNRLVFGRHNGLVSVSLALERCAVDPRNHTPHAIALSQLAMKMAAVKEIRQRLLQLSVGKWLVSLVFTHIYSPHAAHAAQLCIKTLEVDEEGIRAVEVAVKERLAQAPAGSDAGSVHSIYSVNRADRARVHWTDKVMQIHEAAAGNRSTSSQASSTDALMQRYLREQAAAGGDGGPGGGRAQLAQVGRGGVWASHIPGTPPVFGTPMAPATPAGTPPQSSYATSVASHSSRRRQPLSVAAPDPTISEESVTLPSQSLETLKAKTQA